MNAYSMDEMVRMRNAVWATRDGCFDHYPRRCPEGCPHEGRHDAELALIGACDCRDCGFGVTDTDTKDET